MKTTTKTTAPSTRTTGFATIETIRLEHVTGGSRTYKDGPDAKDARADQYNT